LDVRTEDYIDERIKGRKDWMLWLLCTHIIHCCWCAQLGNKSESVYVIAEGLGKRKSICRYFKKIHVPELEVLELAIDEKHLTWQHRNNTLIITYSKPPLVREADTLELKALREFNTDAEHGNTDCKQQ
jgi:hypothetical protein